MSAAHERETAASPAGGTASGTPRLGTANLIPAGPGNDRAAVHHGYSLVKLEPRAAELADDLRAIVPARTEADEPTLRLLALQLARIETVNAYLAEHGLWRGSKGEVQPVLKVLSTWENSAARLCDALGLTPTSRARLGLDLTRARGAALSDHLERRYGHGGEA